LAPIDSDAPPAQDEPAIAPPTPPTAVPTPPTAQSEPAIALATPPAVQSEPASSPPTPPAAQPARAQPAAFAPASHRWPRRGLWAIGAIGVLAIIATVTGLVLWPPGHAPRRHHHPASPQAVVRAYIRDINKRDYRAAWRLGGDNIGGSYQRFVAGFRLT